MDVTVSGTMGETPPCRCDVHLTEKATVRENVIAGGGSVQLSEPSAAMHGSAAGMRPSPMRSIAMSLWRLNRYV